MIRFSGLMRWARILLLCATGGLGTLSSQASDLALSDIRLDHALGEFAECLKESGPPRALADVQAAYAEGKFSPCNRPILTFGIGSRPVWVRLAISNIAPTPLFRQLRVENSWMDHLDVYFVRSGRLTDRFQAGDSQPFRARPVASRFLLFGHDFAPGLTEIYLRLDTPDPMVAPVFLLDSGQARNREIFQGYGYGFIYGYLFALMAYNLLIYGALKNRSYLFYALYLAAFIMANVAYTGHGFEWLWPDDVALQRWIIPTMMVLFGVTGLAFAGQFLETRSAFPRAHAVVAGACWLALALLLGAFLGGSQVLALQDAFVFVTFFTFAMLALGLLSLRSGHRFARYFVIASVASMVGASVTALSVWGLVTYSEWGFRAAEIGMLVDATLLALALAQQFRLIQAEGLQAARQAAKDPLTRLDNRRAFLEKARGVWNMAQRNNRALSLVMLDIDHFKSINDRFGHAAGDAVLVAAARLLSEEVREGDVVSRWGGEEFLVLLPETGIEEALTLTQRLQQSFHNLHFPVEGEGICVTASFGVAQKSGQQTLEDLISEADVWLYRAKRQGRNRACSSLGETVGPMPAVQGVAP
ncbi:MAG: GGDEF domain-containing protein [Betaproteobacteria bacterium]|nr:GGDEF domain-containing protein [Betaproteobacteria bacterium]